MLTQNTAPPERPGREASFFSSFRDLLIEYVFYLLMIQNAICVYRLSIYFYMNNIFRAYPKLRETGGFQLLISEARARKNLKVVSHGSCTTEQLRCFGTGRIYIRPLQRSITTQDVKVDEEFEECIACGSVFAVSEMRHHQETCEVHKLICFNFV